MASEWVSIKAAGERYGVSVDTIRRRLKRGELAGRKEATAQGFAWVVEVPAILEAPPADQDTAAHEGGEPHELVRLRERVAGLERLAAELAEDRNAWREQAQRDSDAARELRILVQHAQTLALPTQTAREDAPGRTAPAREGSWAGEQGGGGVEGRRGLWARLRRK